jgi:hypothetical protein
MARTPGMTRDYGPGEGYTWNIEDRVSDWKNSKRLGTIKFVAEDQLSVMVQWDDFEPGKLEFRWEGQQDPYPGVDSLGRIKVIS